MFFMRIQILILNFMDPDPKTVKPLVTDTFLFNEKLKVNFFKLKFQWFVSVFDGLLNRYSEYRTRSICLKNKNDHQIARPEMHKIDFLIGSKLFL